MSDAPKTFTVTCHEGVPDTFKADKYEVDGNGYLNFWRFDRRIASYSPAAWKAVWEDEASGM